jgi:pyruvate kinase
MALVWGIHAVPSPEVSHVTDMVNYACRAAQSEGFAHPGETVVIVAGLPFGAAGNTNLLHVVNIEDSKS